MLVFCRISTERLEVLGNEIAASFEGENVASYIQKGYKENNVSVSPAGKLYCHLNYRKGVLQENSVLRRRNPRPVLDANQDPPNDFENNGEGNNHIIIFNQI